MGAPMARRLAGAGHDVIVWNRTPAKADGFETRASSAVDAVGGADVVITMLADAEAVREVMFGSGVARSLRPDAVYIDMGTIGVRAAKRLHETVERATLDAPVGGGVAQASSGRLTVLVGGEPAVLDRARSVLEVFGDVVACGGAGAGQSAKLVFNAVLAVTMAGIGEAVALGERLGLDTSLVLDVLERGGAAPMVGRKREMIQRHAFAASFALSLMRKDVGLVREAGRDAKAWLPLIGVTDAVYERAESLGFGDGDYSGVTELFRSS
jgi:3-hydroxyisobutyrate dehydrogenase-like beta-hydroxyacid dehydrogenase